MELHGKKVVLRAVEEEDLEMLRTLTNSPDFENRIVGWSFPISKSQQTKWFEQTKNSSNSVRYIITTKEHGAVGMLGFRAIDWKNGVAEDLGTRIAKKELRGKGIATDAWMTMLRYAFDELRLNRVNASILADNKSSLRLVEKVGFKIEGVQRQAIYKHGKYEDLVLVGCLKSDYEDLLKQNQYWEEEL